MNVTIIWKSGLCRCNEGKMRLYWIRVGPNPITGVLIRRSGEDEDRDRSDETTSQGIPRTVHTTEARREDGADPPPQPSAGAWPC